MASDRDRRQGLLDTSPIHLLHRAGQCATIIFESEMAEMGLTPRQYAVLYAVANNSGASQTTIVALTGIDRSTLTDLIRRLLKKGLLRRARLKEDARAYAVRLSEEGQRVLKTAEPICRRVDARLIQVLPAASRERFLQSLSQIVSEIGRLTASK